MRHRSIAALIALSAPAAALYLAVLCALALCSALFGLGGAAEAAEDRYGPPAPYDPYAAETPAPQGYLAWPGKSAGPANPPAPRVQTETSIGAPAPQPAQAPTRIAAQSAGLPGADGGAPPRFYSVHRQFGVTPDPIPLPAQFFAETAAGDLAAPPPALQSTSGGQSTTAAQRQRAAISQDSLGDATTSN